jgi:hypothetical protein
MRWWNCPPTQQTEVIQDFSSVDVAPVPEADIGTDIAVGAVVPGSIELHAVPETIVKVVPRL